MSAKARPTTPETTDLAPQAAAKRLFAEDGPLGRDGNPALLLDGSGAVLASNAAASLLLPLLTAPTEEFAAALVDARAGTAKRLAAFETAGNGGKPLSLDLSLLPCGSATLLLARDVSLERALRSALIDSRQRFKDLVDRAADFTWEIDAEGRFRFVSGQSPLGRNAHELVGQSPQTFAISPDAPAAFSAFAPNIWMWVTPAGACRLKPLNCSAPSDWCTRAWATNR